MYFKGSMTKIAKVRPLMGSIRHTRHTHTSYTKQQILSKCDELCTAKSVLSKFPRRFSVVNSKQENEKTEPKFRTVGLDLMAPNFKSNRYVLQSTVKNRKEIGGRFHTMPQKSLALKMCRQPAKHYSTSRKEHPAEVTGAGQSNSKEDQVKKDDDVIVVGTSRADICHAICGPKPSNFTFVTTSQEKQPESAIDRLTDAEIEEICKTRCPCRQYVSSSDTHTEHIVEKTEGSMNPIPVVHSVKYSDATHSTQNVVKTEDHSMSSTPIVPSEKYSDATHVDQIVEKAKEHSVIAKSENTSDSTHTNQSEARSMDPMSAVQTGSSAKPIQSADKIPSPVNSGKLESLTTATPHTVEFDARKKRANRIVNQKFLIRRRTSEARHHQRNLPFGPYRNFLQHVKYELPKADDSRQPPRNNPDIAMNNITKGGQVQRPSMYPVQSLPLRATDQLTSKYQRMLRTKQPNRLPFRYVPTNEEHMQSINYQTFQTKRNVNQRVGYTKNWCHMEQLKPVPFRYRPIYSQNYHADPVVQERTPGIHSKHMGMTYKSHRVRWHERQMLQRQSPAFGSERRRNRQTVTLQSNESKSIPLPEFADRTTVVDKVIALPISDDLLNKKLNVEQTQQLNVRTENADTQQSRKILSELMENVSVVVDGPGKLKLIKSTYPQLRNGKDVIIRMEYVNLTDADARHFMTGKYNTYSYATTTVGRTGSGIIIETGKDVRNVKSGDKVFVQSISCGKCTLCSSDQRNLCEYVTATEMSPIQGILSRLHVHSSEFVMKIPDEVSIAHGAMTGTLSTAIRACQKAAVSAGDFVMVIHGEPLGIATGLAAQLMGATTVCLADSRKSVLDDAQKLGIDKVFLIDPKSPSRNTAIKVWEMVGHYPRITFDCRGSQLTNEIAMNATQTGGKIVAMTSGEFGVPLHLSNLVARDIDVIVSTFGNDESDAAALRILKTKNDFFGNFMDKHYDLSNVQEAFDHLCGPNRLGSQIIVKCGCKCGEKVNTRGKSGEQKI